jgi:hypothetical protein
MPTRKHNLKLSLRLLALTSVVAGCMTFGCATQYATLDIIAPANVIAGLGFTITVTAMVSGQQDKIFNSEIHFTSSDPAAILPGDYQFTEVEAGSHTFTNLTALMTPGTQTITATVTTSPGINGTAKIVVSPRATSEQF